ncbi:oligosaccharide repeat unit polymerase [Yoonia sp. SDW83-1]|uniref:oligosaccharide repeat unit polymerase n=1 Tax=Yoonia sp. SDW83-1 TaxID=3366945 RepID=UPI00398C435C
MIILLALLCTAVPFMLGQRYGLVRLVSPMHLVAYFCFFGFLLKVTVYAARPELAFYRRFVENPWGDQLGAIYLALFILLLCAGYRVACRASRRADMIVAARLVSAGITRKGSLFVVALGVALATIIVILRARGATGLDLALLTSLNTAKQINVDANGIGATLAGIKTFFIIPKFAFVLLLASAIATRQRRVMVQAGLLGLLLIVIALISGDRFELVELTVFALVVHMMLVGRVNLRLLAFGALALMLLGGVSAYMTQLRLGGGPIWAALADQVVGSTYFLDINAAIMVTDRVTPPDLLLGQSYTWWSFGWVPRGIWPDKPAIDLGVFFKRDIMGVHTGGAFNVTGPGEAFINFGWAGIGIGFVLGWVYRKGEVFLLSARGTFRHGTCLLYPILFYPFVQATLQSSFSAFIVGAAAQFVLLAVMIWVFVARYSLWIPSHTRNRSLLHVA